MCPSRTSLPPPVARVEGRLPCRGVTTGHGLLPHFLPYRSTTHDSLRPDLLFCPAPLPGLRHSDPSDGGPGGFGPPRGVVCGTLETKSESFSFLYTHEDFCVVLLNSCSISFLLGYIKEAHSFYYGLFY